MRKIFFLIVIFLILTIGTFLVSSAHGSNKVSQDVYDSLDHVEKVRVIIKLQEPSQEKGFLIKTQKTVLEINLEKQEIKENVLNDVTKVKHVLEDSLSAIISLEELNKLEKNNYVTEIKLEGIKHIFLQDSVPLVNASVTWPVQINNQNLSGVDETICIIDTGIYYNHSDFGNCYGNNNASSSCKIIGGWDFCANDDALCTGEDNDSIDVNGHGTHVAGIAAANGSIKGVAPDARIIMIKAANPSGTLYDVDIIAGINWCVNNASEFNISVISMSFGDGFYDTYCNSDSLASSINAAVAQNISVVISTGNDYNTTHISSPACVQSAIPVGASTKSDGIASYSNRNNLTNLFAPGGDGSGIPAQEINSTQNGGGYIPFSGTSMSAPHVSGAIALINQFLKLSGQTKTPQEIESALNSTGKIIYDSGSGLNFSRIDVYSAILSLDETSPNISLISPANSLISQNINQSFSCNASDDFGLSNITFYLWNSTAGIYNQTTANASGTFNQTSFSITNISSGNYEWNCLAYDINNNSAFASSNFSLQIGNISVSLNSPSNNTFTNQNQTFNCSAETNTEAELLNISFYLWNSTSLIYNLSENISGTSNSITFEYNFTDELDFYWNCEAYNNLSENSFAENNYTITYDVSTPLMLNITSKSVTTSSAIISWSTNEETNSTIVYWTPSATLNSSNFSTNHSFSLSSLSSSTTYYYNLTNCDKAGNCNNSNENSFTTLTAPPTTISSGGGGGGSSSSFQTYKPSVEQISEGYAKELREKDKMEFSLSKENIEKHTLTLNDVEENFVNITIQSNLIEIILGIGQDAKLNLTSPDYYDLYVKLENIVNKKANITIQTINEKILKQPTRTIHEESLNETKEQDSVEEIKSLNSGTEKLKIIIYILMLIFIIAFIFILLRKLDKKNEITKTINEGE